ncbi:TetR/AcrR family transcriptional regulator [Actinoplanes sp. NPDC049265]|uniref:TetR/AcrR family transcriptional regulator n=1 Tax=Actinoplanes sp. NPDC049265 TaxID=3363902 RepID=UPI0037184825
MPEQRRADAQRNRTRILETAVVALAEGDDLSLNAVARQAGVGVGTVYRQFPTPEALVLAVYEREVEDLVGVVPALLRRYQPAEAFRVWVTEHLANYMATKRGLARALRLAGSDDHDGIFDRITRAVTELVAANITAGTVRADIEARTVLRALHGLMLMKSDDARQAESVKLVDLLWEGMRTRDDPDG